MAWVTFVRLIYQRHRKKVCSNQLVTQDGRTNNLLLPITPSLMEAHRSINIVTLWDDYEQKHNEHDDFA